ncbi:MAG: carboxy-S-adenosyl-L-methionine synthase CmoA [SAR324 cluster bacterium]|nr:carboxy-S-adenosyl-L-methionine synthase CmoA [SAR324 cluster bacterium]
MKDQIFRQVIPEGYKFTFDESVAEVFDDMLHRSVPLYQEVNRMVVEISASFYQPQSVIYDLGCSTGAVLCSLSKTLTSSEPSLVGIDSSQAMISKASKLVSSLCPSAKIEFRCENILHTSVTDASVIIMNYTLQFIPLPLRQAFLDRLFEALRPGGILLLGEKVKASSKIIEELEVKFYEQFKKRNGYSEMEISQKRKALEEVLIPRSLEQNMDCLKQAGFAAVEVICKWYNFASFLAIKASEPNKI